MILPYLSHNIGIKSGLFFIEHPEYVLKNNFCLQNADNAVII